MAGLQLQSASCAAGNLSKVTEGINTLFIDALNDVKEVNCVLREVVNSDDTLNTTGDPRISTDHDIENFKHAIRERLVASNDFTEAIRSVASYASSDEILKNIKEELSKNSHKELESYLNVIKKHLRNCRECLENIQTNYSYISRLAQKCITKAEASKRGRCILPTLVTAGSSLVGLAGFFVVKLALSTFQSRALLPLSGDHDSLEELSKTPSTKQQSPRLYRNEFSLVCLLALFGATIGIGFSVYLAKRFGFHQQLGRLSRKKSSTKEEAVAVMFQPVVESISTFLSKLRLDKTTRRIHDLEQCLVEINIECAPDKENVEVIKVQLDKLQHETNTLLTQVHME